MMAAGTRPKSERTGSAPDIGPAEEDAESRRVRQPAASSSPDRDGEEAPAGFLRADEPSIRSKKYCLKTLGSSVEPDLLETMKSVFFRSTLFSKPSPGRIGRIEHVKFWEPADRAEGRLDYFRTEARSPHSQQQDMGEARTLGASLIAVRRSMWASWSLVMPSHPSHCASSLPLHSDASRPRAFSPCPGRATPPTTLSRQRRAARGVYVKRLRLPAPASLVCFSTLSSFPKASEKSCTPSTSSLSVHFLHGDADFGERGHRVSGGLHFPRGLHAAVRGRETRRRSPEASC